MALIKVLAKLNFLETSKRKTPFTSGYRPAFTFLNASTKLSGQITLLNKKYFNKGETAIVEIAFIKGIINDTYFKVGQKFHFAEEPNKIGDGEILQVLDQKE